MLEVSKALSPIRIACAKRVTCWPSLSSRVFSRRVEACPLVRADYARIRAAWWCWVRQDKSLRMTTRWDVNVIWRLRVGRAAGLRALLQLGKAVQELSSGEEMCKREFAARSRDADSRQ